ncbi:MAG: hypothetical protein WC661_13205 [Opitutaceae bacterium]|jgi:hypothetical protein
MIARRNWIALGLALLAMPAVRGDDPQWDWLANTQWYVPTANLLAYLAPGTDLSTTLPIGDQTLWNITSSANGLFTGSSQATLTVLGSPTVSTSAMSGIVTAGGQVRIVFTPDGDSAGGPTTVGIGQVRDVGLGTQIEMQMMTGSGSSYVTHWAYMTQLPAGEFTPPNVYDEGTLLSTEWAWVNGTSWELSAPGLFGTADAALFSVSGYRNGYFWGTGVAPASEGGGTFTHLGSITPEGNVLFNVLSGGTLTNLTGQITGDAATATMALRGYTGTDTFGDAAVATAIPEPAATGLLLASCAVGLAVARMRRRSVCRLPALN